MISTFWSLEPANVTLFGERDFEGVIKLKGLEMGKLCWLIDLYPKFHHRILIEVEGNFTHTHTHTHTHTQEKQYEGGTERFENTGVTGHKPGSPGSHHRLEDGRNGSSLEPPKRVQPCQHRHFIPVVLTCFSGLQSYKKLDFFCFCHQVCGDLFSSCPRKVTQAVY